VIRVIKSGIITAFTVLSMVILMMTVLSARAYAGSVTDEEGATYSNIYSAVNSLADGDSATLTVEGDVTAGSAAGAVLDISRNVDILILSGSDDASINGNINISGGGRFHIGKTGETNNLSMDGQISISYGELGLYNGLDMNKTASGDGCVYAGSWDKDKPVELKIDGCSFSTTKCNHAIHLVGAGAHAEYIKNSEIVNDSFRTDHALFVESGAKVDDLLDVSIKGDRNALSLMADSEIGNIEGCSIEASVTALSVSDGSKVGTITDSGITNLDKCTDGSVTSDKSRYSAVRVLSSDENASGIDTVSGCTVTCNGNDYYSGAFYVRGTNGHKESYINTIDDCDMILNNRGHGIYMTGDMAQIGTVTDSRITSKYRGVTLENSGQIENILSTEISLDSGEVSGYAYGVYCKGSIGKIADNCVITVSSPEASGISVSGGQIGTITDAELDISGKTGSFGIAISKAAVEKIADCTINATGTGRLYGIYNQPGAIDYLTGTTIEIDSRNQASGFCVYQQGPTKEVSDCVFIAKGDSNGRYGYNLVDTDFYADPDYPARLDLMKDTAIVSGLYALAVQQDAELGVLSGNHFYSDGSDYGSIYLSVGGVIEDIKSGTYASKGSGVFIRYGVSPGASGVRTGTLKKISYEERTAGGKTVKQGPVFYGETGWAINTNTEGPAPKIEAEKTKVEEDQPVRGYARYYGGAAKAGGLGNGDAVIGTGSQDRDIAKDSYPTYHDSAADGTASDPEDYLYFMSKKGTDKTVSDAVLKDLANIDISGEPFHYLTVKARLRYDPNDDDGPAVVDPSAMDAEKVLGEYGAAYDIAANKYVRKGATFTGWNTRADGSGESYEAGDPISLTKASTTLYAQWSFPGEIELTIKLVNLDWYADLQYPKYISYAWLLQKFYGGGAASLKNSAGVTVDSFTGAYRYTFKDLPPGEYTIVLDVLDNPNLILVGGVHNGTPPGDNLILSPDSDRLKVTIQEDSETIRRFVLLEPRAYGFRTKTDVGTFSAEPPSSEVPGAPSSDGKEYVYYDVREKGNNWDIDNPDPDTLPYAPYAHHHLGIYHGEHASLYKGMESLKVPVLSDDEKKQGYEFKGWKLEGDESGKVYTEEEALAHIVKKHTVFHAVWEKKGTPDPPAPEKHTITYKLNGGEYDGGTGDIKEEYDEGAKIKIHEAPVREGYTFLYWKGSEYQPGDEYTVTEDHTFTAQWKKNDPGRPDDKDDPAADDTEKAGKRKGAKTGDASDPMIWLMLLTGSAGAMIALAKKRTRADN